MNNKLSLIVNFIGIDKMSGAMKNILNLGERGSKSLRGLTADSRRLSRELRDVQRELKGASGNVTRLVDRETALEKALAGVNRQIERQKRIAAIDTRTARLTARGDAMVAKGQSGLFGAALLAAPIYEIAKSGAEYEALNTRLRTLGLGTAAVKDLDAYAQAMNVAGSSAKDNLRYLLEAQGVFRETGAGTLAEQLAGAKLMGPLLAKLNAATKAMGQEMGEEQERYFLRFVEQAGGLASPKRAATLADGLFRALQSSGGNVNAANYQSFLARAGVAGTHLSTRSMFADFEPLIAELHDQAGVGLATAFKRAGALTVNSRAANEFLRLGLWDRSKVVFNQMGGVKTTNGNPLAGGAAAMLAHDPVEFYRRFILPAYQRHGINSSEQRAFENAKLFGGTGGNLFNLIDKQLPTILRSRGAFTKTQSLQTAYQATQQGFFGEQGKMRAAWQDFMVVAGTKGGLLDQLVFGMRAATSALKSFTAFGNAHPTAFAWIGKTVTWLLTLRVGLSLARIGFGYLLGPVARLWGLWSKYRELGSIAAMFPRVAGVLRTFGSVVMRLGPLALRSFGLIRTAALFLARGVLRAGLMMLANPIVLAITGIVVALGVAGYLIYRNWDKIKAAFTAGWTYVKGLLSRAGAWMADIGHRMMQGLLLALDPRALANKLLGIAKSGITAFKNFFGIKSPSRLFMAMGGHLTQGLALGIDRGRHAPVRAVGRMASRTAAAGAIGLTPMRRAARGSGGHRGGPGGPITIHVHGTPGQSVQDLARAVARELKRVDRTRQLSSYEEAA